jgi:hypothetical protein
LHQRFPGLPKLHPYKNCKGAPVFRGLLNKTNSGPSALILSPDETESDRAKAGRENFFAVT